MDHSHLGTDHIELPFDMSSRPTEYAERIRTGFGRRVFELRAAGKCGSLMPVAKTDGCYELITMDAVIENVEGFQPWIDATAQGETFDPQEVFEAFTILDKQNSWKLSGGRFKASRESWAKAERDKMLKMLKLLISAAGRSHGSKRAEVREMKAAIRTEAVPTRRLSRKTSDADVEAASKRPRTVCRRETDASSLSGSSALDVLDLGEYPRTPRLSHDEPDGESVPSDALSAPQSPDTLCHESPEDDSSCEPAPREKPTAALRSRLPPALANFAEKMPKGHVNMPAHRLAIRQAKQARAEKRKAGPVIKKPASKAQPPAEKRKAGPEADPDILEVRTPCASTVKQLYKILASFVDFEPRHSPGKTIVRKKVERGKAMYQVIAYDKSVLGQVTAQAYGLQGGLDLATCMRSRTASIGAAEGSGPAFGRGSR